MKVGQICNIIWVPHSGKKLNLRNNKVVMLYVRFLGNSARKIFFLHIITNDQNNNLILSTFIFPE